MSRAPASLAWLVNEIADLDELAWGAEDREQFAKARKYRARMAELQTELARLTKRANDDGSNGVGDAVCVGESDE